MSRKDRRDLIRQIERKRGSKVVTYVTSDRSGLSDMISGDAVPAVGRHVRQLIGPRTTKFDLFIYSRGGDTSVPWALVSMIREFCGERPFGVLIPFRAHSAATVIALGADEILMTRMGELGPIDATHSGPHNPRDPETKQPLPISVEDARGYLSFLDTIGLKNPTHKISAFGHLSGGVHPLALGSVHRILSQTKKVAKQLLESRHEPLSKTKNEDIVSALASEIASHEHTIRRTEAAEIGIDFVKNAEEQDIEDLLWNLYEAYADYFEWQCPFDPDMPFRRDPDLDEKLYEGLPVSCIESTWRADVKTVDVWVRRLREVPPQVTLSFPNLQISLPQVPEGLDQAGLEQYIHQMLTPIVEAQIQAAVDAASREMKKSLPEKGFQTRVVNTRWSRSTS